MVCRLDAGEQGNGEMSVQPMGEMGKDFCPNLLKLFLGGMDGRSLFLSFTTLTEKAGPLLRERPLIWSRGALEWEGEQIWSDPHQESREYRQR